MYSVEGINLSVRRLFSGSLSHILHHFLQFLLLNEFGNRLLILDLFGQGVLSYYISNISLKRRLGSLLIRQFDLLTTEKKEALSLIVLDSVKSNHAIYQIIVLILKQRLSLRVDHTGLLKRSMLG
jgi:hypothetical protein